MKTLFLFENGHETVFLFEVEGDHSSLNGVFINEVGPKKGPEARAFKAHQDLLDALVFGKEGEILPKKLEAPTKDWDFFVHCGFLD